MDKEKKSKTSTTTLIKTHLIDKGLIIFLIFILANIVAGSVGHIKVWGMLKYLYITIAAVFLPGWLLQQRLKINFKNDISCIFFSFALGFSLSILLYACLLLIKLQLFAPYIFYGFSFISIALWLYFSLKKEQNQTIRGNAKETCMITILMLLVFSIGFVLFQMSQQSALYIGYQNIYPDSTYWFKCCVASTKGYPLPELSVHGVHLYWHLFSCFYIALLHLCTRVEIYDLCYNLSYLWDAFLLTGAIYVILNEFLEQKKLVFLGCFILLFVGGFEKQLGFTYLEHIYQCKLGVVEGFAFSLYAFLFIVRVFKNEKLLDKELFLSFIFFAAATGAKVPYACIMLVGVGCLTVFSFNKKNWWKNLIILTCYLGIFLLISKIFIIDGNALNSDSSSHQLSLSYSGSALLVPKAYDIYLVLSDYIGKTLSWVIITGGFILGINFVVSFMFLYAIIVAIIRKRYRDIFLLTLFFMTTAGICLSVFLHHPGRSQMYFGFAAIPFAVLFALLIYDQCEFKTKKISLCCIYGLITLSLITSVLFGPKNFCGGGTYKHNDHPKSINGNDITRDEIIALQWIRHNLPEDIILATNKILAPESKLSFVTSAYSERQVYFEGYKATNLPYAGIVDERISLLSDYYAGNKKAMDKLVSEGVTYSVLYKAFGTPNELLGDVIFENSAMVVYKLN